jgi:hypothetical protein
LDKPIDWGGIIVVGLFALASMIVSAYIGQTAGKLVGSVPDLMTLGNVNISGSAQETALLKGALTAGRDLAAVRTVGAKEAAEHQTATGQIDVEAWTANATPVLLSFAKFVKDLDAATGDNELKQLVKDLALRLQERLAAKARTESAERQLTLAAMRVEGVRQQRQGYGELHTRARNDATLLRETALALLGVVRTYGDVFLDYQIRAARAVEIYTMQDQSAAMGLDRWHVHPDTDRDFVEALISPTAYQGQLLVSTTELGLSALVTTFDTYDMSGYQPDVHYVTIDDAADLASFRQLHTVTVAVTPADLAGQRFAAKVIEATVVLHGVTALTPTFALLVTHEARSTDRLPDGTEVVQLGSPRSAQVQAALAGNTAIGAVAFPDDGRPTEFWRRSVAADWSLSIEEGVVVQRQVDLTDLTRIDLALTYIARSS